MTTDLSPSHPCAVWALQTVGVTGSIGTGGSAAAPGVKVIDINTDMTGVMVIDGIYITKDVLSHAKGTIPKKRRVSGGIDTNIVQNETPVAVKTNQAQCRPYMPLTSFLEKTKKRRLRHVEKLLLYENEMEIHTNESHSGDEDDIVMDNISA
eukprot:CAMPEP_0182433002 /NCGR_PEP_ID=MMETSP1167-20130531/60175_1 /TAXON_ID=2988 /ORGANISM="Mallomonas Sp, Strain CCMP3275" /LENGTH=151 /DNA_ID=CAMNT_0024621139 /DNA_START=690 /DNA_END=1145 /DNA_ORIENTATION=+